MPVVVQWILAAVVSLALAWLLRPKSDGASQASVAEPPGDAEIPTVEEGKAINVFFGVVWTGDPTIVWWGDTSIATRTYQEQVNVQ